MICEAESPRRRMLEVFNELKYKLSAEIDKYRDESYSEESLSITKMFELKTQDSKGKNLVYFASAYLQWILGIRNYNIPEREDLNDKRPYELMEV